MENQDATFHREAQPVLILKMTTTGVEDQRLQPWDDQYAGWGPYILMMVVYTRRRTFTSRGIRGHPCWESRFQDS